MSKILAFLLLSLQQVVAQPLYGEAHAHFAERGWDTSTIVVAGILILPVFVFLIYTIVNALRHH